MDKIGRLNMKFRLRADTTLDAENIIDALSILAEYFDELASTGKSTDEVISPFTSGTILLEPCETEWNPQDK